MLGQKESPMIESQQPMKNRLAALFDVARELASVSSDLQEVLSFILNNVHAVMHARAASLMLKVEGKEELYFAQVRGSESKSLQSKTIKFGEGISGKAALSKQTINVPDAYQEPDFDSSYDKKTGFKTRQILTCPMLHKDGVVGVISVFNTINGQRFSAADEQLIRIFADQASIALINTLKYAKLEKIIDERTSTIRTILDHVQSGFFLIDSNLVVEQGYSQSCKSLLGEKFADGYPVSKFLYGDKPKDQTEFMGWKKNCSHFDSTCTQVFDDMMPESVTLGQVPNKIIKGDQYLSLQAKAVRNSENKIKSLLFTVNDVTELAQTELENSQNRALLKILKYRSSFEDFVAESFRQISDLKTNSDQIARRSILHTLKGNSYSFGLSTLALKIHDFENALRISDKQIEEIESWLTDFLQKNFHILDIDPNNRTSEPEFTVTETQLNDMQNEFATLTSLSLVNETLERWQAKIREEPFKQFIMPFIEPLTPLAKRLGKEVKIVIEGGNTRVDHKYLLPIFQPMVHLLRNAIDHGIEPPFAREGKDPTGRLTLTMERTDVYSLTVQDDGGGIDSKKLRQKAVEKSILTQEKANSLSETEALLLIFQQGLSTSEEVSDISGRGVGMGAVKEAIEQVGGTIQIESQVGKGTKFRIRIPEKSNSPQLMARPIAS